jgi:hypothetical protein
VLELDVSAGSVIAFVGTAIAAADVVRANMRKERRLGMRILLFQAVWIRDLMCWFVFAADFGDFKHSLGIDSRIREENKMEEEAGLGYIDLSFTLTEYRMLYRIRVLHDSVPS